MWKSKQKKAPDPFILAIHPGALGDCILLGRVLEKLDGEVTFVGHGAVMELLVGLGAVSKKIDFDLLEMQELFVDAPIEQSRLAKQLGTCDKLISVFGQGNPAVEQRLIRVTGAKEAVFLPIRPPAEYAGHLTELWLEKLASPLTRENLCTSAWCVPGDWQQAGQRRRTQAGVVDKKYVILHPGAGGAEKRWPIERFVEVAQAIQIRRNVQPVFVLGPVEREMFTESEKNFLSACPVLSEVSLEEFSGILAGAEALIGNDSGPVHLAASIGITTICIYCATSVVYFCPLGRDIRVFPAERMSELVAEDVVRVFLNA
jgi:hypothetical protein